MGHGSRGPGRVPSLPAEMWKPAAEVFLAANWHSPSPPPRRLIRPPRHKPQPPGSLCWWRRRGSNPLPSHCERGDFPVDGGDGARQAATRADRARGYGPRSGGASGAVGACPGHLWQQSGIPRWGGSTGPYAPSPGMTRTSDKPCPQAAGTQQLADPRARPPTLARDSVAAFASYCTTMWTGSPSMAFSCMTRSSPDCQRHQNVPPRLGTSTS